MINTTEIRWFVPGKIPKPVDEWFDNCPGEWIDQPERTDSYYRLSGGQSLGIKLRQGRLEMKERSSPSEVFRIQNEISGLIETWRKWSFELAGDDEVASWETSANKLWLAVKKTRKLHLYRLTSNGTLSPQDSAQGSLCQVELTGVFAQGTQWWSLGFEASGAEAKQQEYLKIVANKLLGHVEGIHLREIDSMSYPDWMGGIPV